MKLIVIGAALVSLTVKCALAGAPGSRFNPYRSTTAENGVSRRRRQCTEGVDYGPGIGQPPDECEVEAPSGGGGGGGGGDGGSSSTPASDSSHAAAMLNQVGVTDVAVAQADIDAGKFTGDTGTGGIGEDIYGPFEAGFTSQQDFIFTGLGCSDPSVAYIDGGIDTSTAEKIVASACDVTLPRFDDDGEYISLLDQCGGHTKEYHNHEKLVCLYDVEEEGHSSRVGTALDDKGIYGKWEATDVLPELDACGGHWGRTPDSPDVDVYHYHVQDAPPFTVGCFGPNDDDSLVTVQQCRDFYTGCDGDLETFTTTDGEIEYDLWCPCFDANGSNSGIDIAELAVFDNNDDDGDDDGDDNGDDDGSGLPSSGAATIGTASAIVVAVVATLLF